MEREVPLWESLPEPTRRELTLKGLSREWFNHQSPRRRLTFLNLFVKIRGVGFWNHVETIDLSSYSGKDQDENLGCLVFFLKDLFRFKEELASRWSFRTPSDSWESWDAAEKRLEGELHFKHFPGWSRDEKVQAHIDLVGTWIGHPSLWWAGQPATCARHLANYGGYKDVYAIRALLLRQGWDRESLLGVGPWRCEDPECPSHSSPDRKCPRRDPEGE